MLGANIFFFFMSSVYKDVKFILLLWFVTARYVIFGIIEGA